MTTQDRIQQLVEFGQCLKLMPAFNKADLCSWVSTELGRKDALDTFIPVGDIHSKAYAPETLLHIVSGNTTHAAIQSVFRGLLLGSLNIVKIPSTGLPELERWLDQLPRSLQELVTIHRQLADDHWQMADAVVAIGSDSTIECIRQRILPRQKFQAHGHKVSIGIVLSDFGPAAELAAKDISLFNQRGCLSPHAIYVKERQADDSQRFASLLAEAMELFNQNNPPEPISLSEAGSICNRRETTRFEASNVNPNKSKATTCRGVGLWESANSLDWTVIHQSTPALRLSCLNRCVDVRPLPEKLDIATLGPESLHLSSIAIHPFSSDFAESLTHLPAHRICRLGQSQSPSLFWHHDGYAPLASLVDWKDIG